MPKEVTVRAYNIIYKLRYLLELCPLGELCALAIFLNICFPLDKIPFFFLGESSAATWWVPFTLLYLSAETNGDSWNTKVAYSKLQQSTINDYYSLSQAFR